MTARLQFLTREGCHLCDDALLLLQGVPLDVIDIDKDPALHAEFDERVPVVRDGATQKGHDPVCVGEGYLRSRGPSGPPPRAGK